MKKGLGRGLGALIPDASPEETAVNTEKNVETMRLSNIEPNPEQPRSNFDAERLEALAKSIEQYGVISPIIVRKNEKNRFYTIIAGERRWRAAKLAGLKEVPVIVKEYDDKVMSEVALVENLQREDLNPIEEALAVDELMKKYDLTQEEISEKVGKSRSAIANSLRLLSLSDSVKKLIVQQEISAGHARTLVGLSPEQQEKIAFEVIRKELSVRQTEQLVGSYKKTGKTKKEKGAVVMNLAAKELQQSLSRKLGTKVRVKQNDKKGKIEIEFYDDETLNRILSYLNK
ncbi:MAG: ParB/RepB/Spo0J family partition protein [Ruminococcaceae bacterium]|nr:ParB/RepB/Spo0J family partition protein [Oscillospiraceae bacterium]